MTLKKYTSWNHRKIERLLGGWTVAVTILIALLLFSLTNCTPFHNKAGIARVYDRPPLPKIDWVMREVGYMSLRTEEYRELRGYVINMESVVNKYEGQSLILNGE